MGKSISTLDEAAEAAKSIKARGIENVMISLGARGAVLASDDGIFVAEAPKIEALSTIGAGDSSIAGFLYAHINEMGYGECLRHAIAYGSAACLTEGTKPPREEDVKRLLDEVRVNT